MSMGTATEWDVEVKAEQNARLRLLRKCMFHFTGNAGQEHVLHHLQMIPAALVQVRIPHMYTATFFF